MPSGHTLGLDTEWSTCLLSAGAFPQPPGRSRQVEGAEGGAVALPRYAPWRLLAASIIIIPSQPPTCMALEHICYIYVFHTANFRETIQSTDTSCSADCCCVSLWLILDPKLTMLLFGVATGRRASSWRSRKQ